MNERGLEDQSRSNRVHSNGTVKKRSIRVGFRILVRSKIEANPNGTFLQKFAFERGDYT